jgi:hypothetical protein
VLLFGEFEPEGNLGMLITISDDGLQGFIFGKLD